MKLSCITNWKDISLFFFLSNSQYPWVKSLEFCSSIDRTCMCVREKKPKSHFITSKNLAKIQIQFEEENDATNLKMGEKNELCCE